MKRKLRPRHLVTFFVPILTKFFSVYHSKITHLMIYFFTKFNCVSIKLLKDAKNHFPPYLFSLFFSKKIAKSSSKAPKKESFEAINGCTTILQKAIYICYLLCIKERILRLVKKKENLGWLCEHLLESPILIFCFNHCHQMMTFSKHFEFAGFF